MHFKPIIALYCFFGSYLIHAQNYQNVVADSTQYRSFLRKSIVPASLITLGLLVNKSDLEKKIRTSIVAKYGVNYGCHIDDYAQFAPIPILYLGDVLRVKAQHHWFDQSKYLFLSDLLSSTITFQLKKWIGKTRPNGADNLSFPSGHTTFAFTNATVLYEEFKETLPLLAYSGFGFATTTGAYRMINNKHWFSDVLMGAGIGILSTYVIYHFKPLKNWNPFIKSKNVMLLPTVIGKEKGIYLSYRF